VDTSSTLPFNITFRSTVLIFRSCQTVGLSDRIQAYNLKDSMLCVYMFCYGKEAGLEKITATWVGRIGSWTDVWRVDCLPES